MTNRKEEACKLPTTVSLPTFNSLSSNYYHNGTNLFMVINFSGSFEQMNPCECICIPVEASADRGKES